MRIKHAEKQETESLVFNNIPKALTARYKAYVERHKPGTLSFYGAQAIELFLDLAEKQEKAAKKTKAVAA